MNYTIASGRRIVAASGASRPDLLVHALAQLPDDIVLDICGEQPQRSQLELLAIAYGIRGRVRFQGIDDKLETAVASRLRDQPSMADLVESLSRPHDPPTSTSRGADSIFDGHRIAVVSNIPTHYRVPLFEQLSKRLEAAGGTFCVFFLAQPPSTRPWMRPGRLAFDHEFIPGLDLKRDRGRRVVPLSLEKLLARFSPTILLSAGFSPLVSGRAARFASRRGIPFGLWSGEIGTSETARSRLRSVQRRRLVEKANFAVAYGARSAAYLRDLRPQLPLVIGRNTTLLPAPRSHRNRCDVLEILTVSRAERGKGLDSVIEAILSRKDLNCRLTVVGDGSELPALRGLAAGDERIRFLGSVPTDRVRELYPAADVFLFPSRYDIFGLVLVEAMAAGLATLVSDLPGAVDDLCVSGRNCLIVHRTDPAGWAKALQRMVADPEIKTGLGQAAERTIRNRWTLDHACDAMIAGLRLGLLAGGRSG